MGQSNVINKSKLICHTRELVSFTETTLILISV